VIYVLAVELCRPGQLAARRDTGHTGAVVVDLFRATSTLQVLVDAGHRDVSLVATRAGAAAALRRGHRCVGEWQGVTLPGFSCGNSPVLAQRLDPAGPPVTFLSTNGAGALLAARRAAALVYAASLANIGAVRGSLLAHGGSWLLVPAGVRGAPCLEDDYVCALLAARLRGQATLGAQLTRLIGQLAGVTAADLRHCPAARRLARAEPTGRADVEYILAATFRSARIPVCAGPVITAWPPSPTA
jgi:phosphosulfolactate phosphohydrolase-like enzyme